MNLRRPSANVRVTQQGFPATSTHRLRPRMSNWRAVWLLALTLVPGGTAAEKPDAKKPEPPRVLLALPLMIEAGTNSLVRLRGTGITNATGIQLGTTNANVTATLKSKGKADVPKDYDVKRVGDAQVELELKLPQSLSVTSLTLIVTAPEGATAPYELLVAAKGSLLAEREPNGGFRQAQELPFDRPVRGTIGEPGDVDVFHFRGKAGDQITATVTSARGGTPLDGILMLHDRAGHLLATCDDSETSADPALHIRLPADGDYFLTLIDAHDRGSALHAYVLTISRTGGK